MVSLRWLTITLVACARSHPAPPAPIPAVSASVAASPSGLGLVADAPLPGAANRFDYQDIDVARGHLVIAHMNDASVIIANLSDGSVVKVLPGIPTARGVAVCGDRIFVTSKPSQLVILDAEKLVEIARAKTGTDPDGVACDPDHGLAGVSDQHDGAISILADKGSGKRVQVPLGKETGNVVYDAGRKWFWAAVVNAAPPDQLVAIDPVSAKPGARIPLPGCSGAHGVRIHPDGKSAFVACEENDVLVRVELEGAHAAVTAPTGKGPDVMSIDANVLYVAAESGDLVTFDIGQPGLVPKEHSHPGDHAHSVAVDPATHRVFFPLESVDGKPVLRIMKPR